jgi:long-chain acyl-CoA synthetase
LLVSDIPKKNARLYPNRIASIEDDVEFTFFEFNQRVNRLANAILNLGLGKGDRVAVLYYNGYQYIELYFACAKAGTPIVPLNFRSDSKELTYILNNSEAKLLFFGSLYQNTVEEVKPQTPGVAKLVSIDQKLAGYLFYDDIISDSSPDGPSVIVEEDDMVVLGYTGGTTGLPKGVMTTHRNLISSCFNSAVGIRIAPGMVYLNTPPLFHAGDAMAMFAFAFMGATNVTLRTFSPEAVLKTIEKYQVTHGLLVPAMLLAILQYSQVSDFNLKSMECVIYGTAPMPIEPLKKAIKLFQCNFLQVYGATETFVPMSMLLPEDHVLEGTPEQIRRMSSAGREVIGMEAKIVDDDDRELPFGEVGEVIVRGDNVMKGYWKLPELTKETLRNGWYHTGDLGKMDEGCYIYIVDRKKDMIISGGENIYPKEIEDVLYQHPEVAEVAVIGIPDEYWGEAIKALVIKKANSSLTEMDLIEHCKEHLPGYKKPRSIEFVETLPRSTAGKVLKHEIRAQYWQDRDRKV